MRQLIFFFLIGFVVKSNGQESITWDLLADATFETVMDEELGYALNTVNPGPYLKLFDKKEVAIQGYIIPLDALGVSYVLSRNTYASCFFCGNAGPETILQLELKPEAIKKYDTDQRVRFKGTLQINKTDEYGFNYVLMEAEEV